MQRTEHQTILLLRLKLKSASNVVAKGWQVRLCASRLMRVWQPLIVGFLAYHSESFSKIKWKKLLLTHVAVEHFATSFEP